MTMFSNITPFPPATIRSRNGPLGSLAVRFMRLIDRMVAAVIARHQREVELFVLRNLTDRELNDIGICRNEIGLRLEDAARIRGQLQMKHGLPMLAGNPPSSAGDA